MERIFSEILSSVKAFLSFDFLGYICISCFLGSIAIFLLELILISLNSRKSDIKWFSNFSLLIFVLSLVLSAYENQNACKFFKSQEDTLLFSLTFLCLLLMQNLILNLVNAKRNRDIKLNAKKDLNDNIEPEQIEISSNYGSSIKNATLNLDGACLLKNLDDEYIDISHLKSLIDKLKSYSLEENDYKDTENLEVYLLNFISRQPKNDERIILSNHISKLIKNLSYYENKQA